MNKKVIIIHGWDGHPTNCWYPWLKNELEIQGFQVEIPAMPESAEPKIDAWVNHLAKVIDEVDENTYFIGHSIGCQTILRYFEKLPVGKKVGGALFVAGWFNLPNLETEEEKVLAKPWLETPIDFEKVKSHTDKFIAIFSDNDEDVPLTDKELFEQRLNAKTIVEHDKGHFSDDAGVTELPSALDAILSFSK
jgi:hypothetical protein